MVYTCAAYIGGWLPTTLIVLLASFMLVAVVYLIGRLLPAEQKARVTGLTRTEISQLVLSALIVGILLGVTTLGCGFAAAAGNQLLLTPPAPAAPTVVPCPTSVITGANIPISDPMTYSQGYMGYLAFVAGPTLSTQIFATSFQDSLTAGLWGLGSSFFTTILDAAGAEITLPVPEEVEEGDPELPPPPLEVTITFPVGADLSYPFTMLADLGLGVFLPLTMIGISVSFVQYVMLVIIQESAFAILLPIALIMRSLAFTGGGMRTAANGLLALSVALYIIFPLTVSFDHYAVNWMFSECSGAFTSTCNPSAAFVCSTYQYVDYGGTLLASVSSQPITPITILGFSIPFPNVAGLAAGIAAQFASLAGAGNSVYNTLLLLNSTAEYFFITSLMFVINLSMTIGFAMSLSRSLNSGVEGAASFWSNI